MSRKVSFAIAYSVAAVPFLVGVIVTNLSSANARLSVPWVTSEQTTVGLPGSRSECDKLAASDRRSCSDALEAARRDEVAPATQERGINMLRSRTRASMDAGDADPMVAEPKCEVETRHQNGVCEMQLESLPVRMLTA